MKVEFITITPDLAKVWLATSNGNPRWSSKKKFVDDRIVTSIARDIKNGNWKPGNNSIAFDENGVLVDGHHRLSAVVSAKIPVESIVVYGIPEDAQIHIDEARGRTQAQRLSLESRIVSAANCYFRSTGRIYKTTAGSVEMVSEWVKEHPMVFDALSICTTGKEHPISKKGSVVCAATLALEHGVNEDRLKNFFRSVNTGFVSSKEESAAIVIRNMLMSSQYGTKKSENIIFLAVQDAISDYMSGVHRYKNYTKPKGVYMK